MDYQQRASQVKHKKRDGSFRPVKALSAPCLSLPFLARVRRAPVTNASEVSHSEESKLSNHLVEGVDVEMLASIKYLSWDCPNNLMI